MKNLNLILFLFITFAFSWKVCFFLSDWYEIGETGTQVSKIVSSLSYTQSSSFRGGVHSKAIYIFFKYYYYCLILFC